MRRRADLRPLLGGERGQPPQVQQVSLKELGDSGTLVSQSTVPIQFIGTIWQQERPGWVHAVDGSELGGDGRGLPQTNPDGRC